MHALIIEDNGLTAWLIEEELRDLGYYSFEVAGTEAEAVAAACRRRPDLITCDTALAVGSGLAAVRAIGPGSELPVVFVTGDVEAAQDFAPSAVILEKPFTRAALIDAVVRSRLESLS